MGTRKVIGNQLRNRSGIFLIRKKKVVVLPKATTKQYTESKKVLKAFKVQKGAFHLFACVYLPSSTCTVNVLHIRGVVVFLKLVGPNYNFPCIPKELFGPLRLILLKISKFGGARTLPARQVTPLLHMYGKDIEICNYLLCIFLHPRQYISLGLTVNVLQPLLFIRQTEL